MSSRGVERVRKRVNTKPRADVGRPHQYPANRRGVSGRRSDLVGGARASVPRVEVPAGLGDEGDVLSYEACDELRREAARIGAVVRAGRLSLLDT